ncbi:hypothetical protein EV360DRAFT_90398 [Lentinula raphanica]|nr:hypothetical protein EV360DRAFT_90398 [Lentinula raphanica]
MLAALAASGFSGFSRTSGSMGEPSRVAPSPPSSTLVPEPSTSPDDSASATIITRRSQRLSAKKVASTPTAHDLTVDAPNPDVDISSTSSAAIDSEMPPLPHAPPDSEMQKCTTRKRLILISRYRTTLSHLSVVEDGPKVEAQTPDETCVATQDPLMSMNQSASSSSSAKSFTSSRPSYAFASRAKPTDWHLEFAMDDHVLFLDLTIYGAIHQHEMRKKTGATPPSLFWHGVYTIKFKKIPCPAPISDNKSDSGKKHSPTPLLSSLVEDAPHAKVLHVLRVLYQLNILEAEGTLFKALAYPTGLSTYLSISLSSSLLLPDVTSFNPPPLGTTVSSHPQVAITASPWRPRQLPERQRYRVPRTAPHRIL